MADPRVMPRLFAPSTWMDTAPHAATKPAVGLGGLQPPLPLLAQWNF